MNLKNLSDEKLLSATENLVSKERKLLTEVLHHLAEIDRRKLYASLKFTSLFDYAVKKLGYPEDQASRRICALRMLKVLPKQDAEQIEEKLNQGKLCLTHLNMAQSAFRRSEKVTHVKSTPAQKMEILKKMENTSTREAEKIVVKAFPLEADQRFEKVRAVTCELSEMKFMLNADQRAKITQMKGLLAHRNPNLPFSELLDILLDLGIKEFDPARKQVRVYQKKQETAAPRSGKARPAIPAEVCRQIWRRDSSRCTQCASVHALEIDHILPVALGGGNEPENLRLLCRNCNQRAGIMQLGVQQMTFFAKQ